MREGARQQRMTVGRSHVPFLPLPLPFLSPEKTSLKRSSTTTFCFSFFIRRKRGSVLNRAKRGSDMTVDGGGGGRGSQSGREDAEIEWRPDRALEEAHQGAMASDWPVDGDGECSPGDGRASTSSRGDDHPLHLCPITRPHGFPYLYPGRCSPQASHPVAFHLAPPLYVRVPPSPPPRPTNLRLQFHSPPRQAAGPLHSFAVDPISQLPAFRSRPYPSTPLTRLHPRCSSPASQSSSPWPSFSPARPSPLRARCPCPSAYV